MKKITGISFLVLAVSFAFTGALGDQWVWNLLQQLGNPLPTHVQLEPDPKYIDAGKKLIEQGWARNPETNKKGSVISAVFLCTDCHNQVAEFAFPHESSSSKRLEYAMKNNIPFLPGSSFYGIVNRSVWYAGEYTKKYGDWAKRAQNDLSEAIQLCAKECSSGRMLEDWELKAVLAYFNQLQIGIDDLDLSPSERAKLQNENVSNENKSALLQEKLPPVPEAHFLNPISPNQGKKYGEESIQRGKFIYENSCQHCHKPEGPSQLILDDYRSSFQWLWKQRDESTSENFLRAIRYGTSTYSGNKGYMPAFTKEKLSDAQLKDLMNYIHWRSEGN